MAHKQVGPIIISMKASKWSVFNGHQAARQSKNWLIVSAICKNTIPAQCKVAGRLEGGVNVLAFSHPKPTDRLERFEADFVASVATVAQVAVPLEVVATKPCVEDAHLTRVEVTHMGHQVVDGTPAVPALSIRIKVI